MDPRRVAAGQAHPLPSILRTRWFIDPAAGGSLNRGLRRSTSSHPPLSAKPVRGPVPKLHDGRPMPPDRRPHGPARALLRAINADPVALARALNWHAREGRPEPDDWVDDRRRAS